MTYIWIWVEDRAARLVNKEVLALYYSIGGYISVQSRAARWGSNAIGTISELLQQKLPGLRGFSETSIKRMRIFYEAWCSMFENRPLSADDFQNSNPHCHLVYNRINNKGKTITDQNDFRRNEQVTKLLKRKYGLTFSKGKGRTKTERLRGTEKTKYEIYHAVGTGLLRCKSWPEFVNHLKANGVEVEIVMRRNGSKDLKDLQGMRFKKDSQVEQRKSSEGGCRRRKRDVVLNCKGSF